MNNNNKHSENGNPLFGMLGTASTMGMHMISGPLVGGGLGYLCDTYLFNSYPIGLCIGVVLGVFAGFRNIYLDAKYIQKEEKRLDEENRIGEKNKMDNKNQQ